jgi:hypothetical protein
MPEYHFKRRSDGMPVVKFLSMSQLHEQKRDDGSIVDDDGEVLDRDKVSEMRGFSGKASWPIMSEGAGCHPEQIPEMSEFMRRNGVNLDYTSDGRAIFTDAAQRRKALKALGMHDRSGYD